MLVLSRKVNECVWIGSNVQVRVLEAYRDKVKLGFTGPPEVPIHREEVYQRIPADKKKLKVVHER